MIVAWLALAGAIGLEVMATLSLRALSSGWHLLPGVLVVVGYLGAFTLMTLALRQLNVGAVYAIWSGVGTVGITVLAAVLYGERITLLAAAGIAVIVIGVIMVNLGGAAHAG